MAPVVYQGQLGGPQPDWLGHSWLTEPSNGSGGGAVPSYADAVKGTFPQSDFPRKRTAPAIMEGVPSQHLTQEEEWMREMEDMQEQGHILGGGGPLNQGSGLNQAATQTNLEVNPFFRKTKVESRMGQPGMGMLGGVGGRSGLSSGPLPSNEGEESANLSLGAGQGILRRRITADEVQQCTTLHVKGLPVELNTPGVLRSHFSAFGEVANLQCFPEKRFATVEFRTNVRICVRTRVHVCVCVCVCVCVRVYLKRWKYKVSATSHVWVSCVVCQFLTKCWSPL